MFCRWSHGKPCLSKKSFCHPNVKNKQTNKKNQTQSAPVTAVDIYRLWMSMCKKKKKSACRFLNLLLEKKKNLKPCSSEKRLVSRLVSRCLEHVLYVHGGGRAVADPMGAISDNDHNTHMPHPFLLTVHNSTFKPCLVCFLLSLHMSNCNVAKWLMDFYFHLLLSLVAL